MTLQELITDLKAAGCNDNTLRLAMNCYELGQADENEACAKLVEDCHWPTRHAGMGSRQFFAGTIRARRQAIDAKH